MIGDAVMHDVLGHGAGKKLGEKTLRNVFPAARQRGARLFDGAASVAVHVIAGGAGVHWNPRGRHWANRSRQR